MQSQSHQSKGTCIYTTIHIHSTYVPLNTPTIYVQEPPGYVCIQMKQILHKNVKLYIVKLLCVQVQYTIMQSVQHEGQTHTHTYKCSILSYSTPTLTDDRSNHGVTCVRILAPSSVTLRCSHVAGSGCWLPTFPLSPSVLLPT